MARNGTFFFFVAIMIGCASIHRIPVGSDTLPFDSSEWKRAKGNGASDNGPISTRQKMLADLVKTVLPGKTKDEIQSLLGEPDDDSIFPTLRRDFTYRTGWERGNYLGNIDSEWLLIILDTRGRFKEFIIVND